MLLKPFLICFANLLACFHFHFFIFFVAFHFIFFLKENDNFRENQKLDYDKGSYKLRSNLILCETLKIINNIYLCPYNSCLILKT